MNVINDFFRFAFCGTKEQWYDKLSRLSRLALPEDWSYKLPKLDAPNQAHPILENYILHTFKRLVYEYEAADPEDRNNILMETDNQLCFNTGLFTSTYESIYACLKRNRTPDREPWYLVGFSDCSDPFFSKYSNLPRRAKYFSKMSELIYDTSMELRVNTAHIILSNKDRIPEPYRNAENLPILFSGAIELAKKKVEANYKAAVPQFYDGQICFLLPICLANPQIADLSLAVRQHDSYYTAHTCLTLDMAYNNARLIACPNSEWLRP